jgi:Transposase zinc-binding domain
VFRRFAAGYVSIHGASMLASHRRAIEDILDCRTAALGGQVWRCDTCNTEMFSYHSCGNRSCPKCHTAQTREWLEHRQAELLPVRRFVGVSHTNPHGSSPGSAGEAVEV